MHKIYQIVMLLHIVSIHSSINDPNCGEGSRVLLMLTLRDFYVMEGSYL